MGTDQNGDESGKRMVSGGDTVLWKSGICTGKDTRINRSTICFGRRRTDVHADVMPPAGRKGTFDGRSGCRKCFCVTFGKSNKTAVSGEGFFNIAITGVNKNHVPYLALRQRRGEKTYDEKDNQWHDRSRFTGS